MRTTITLDPDVRALLENAMAERDVSFKTALNDAVRSALGREAVEPVSTLSRPLRARVDLTHATRIASELEDEETVRKAALGK